MQRRNFLKIFPSMAAATPFVVNGHSMRPFANGAMNRLLTNCEEVEGRTLVLIQLKGGNDGLNTIIPIAQFDRYATLRPTIKVPETGVGQYIPLEAGLKDKDKIGLNPNLTSLKAMYDDGMVNIIQGVGYQQPNQSHFTSTDLWMSGGDGTPANSSIGSGWMGRALQGMYPDIVGAPTSFMPDPLGIQIGDPSPSLGFHTDTEHQNAINLSGQDVAGFYSLISTIGGMPPTNTPDFENGEEIEYIKSVENSVNLYAQRITQVFNAGTNIGTYPNTSLANQLKTVARMIRGGSKTKIFLCQQGGYDTHDSQVGFTAFDGNHAGLMIGLADGVKAFFDDLKSMSIADQVMACTFSEFGRCAAENGSSGTDHGTLAPMMIFGTGVNAGVTGTNVNLTNLTNDNQLQGLQHDYRQVFTTLLQDWLGSNDYVLEQAMFDGYMKLPLVATNFVAAPDCYFGGTTIINDGGFTKPSPISVFPNPARITAEVALESEFSYPARMTVHNMAGQLSYGGNVQVQQGTNFFYVDVANMPAGFYIVRIEDRVNGEAFVVKLQVVK